MTSPGDVSNEFKCPVCYNLIIANVLQCSNGHLICSDCASQSKDHKWGLYKCPECRVEMPRFSRCLLAEKIRPTTEFPCDHQGCHAVFLGTEIAAHLRSCLFKLVQCPICPNVVVKSGVLLDHIFSTHELEGYCDSISIPVQKKMYGLSDGMETYLIFVRRLQYEPSANFLSAHIFLLPTAETANNLEKIEVRVHFNKSDESKVWLASQACYLKIWMSDEDTYDNTPNLRMRIDPQLKGRKRDYNSRDVLPCFAPGDLTLSLCALH